MTPGPALNKTKMPKGFFTNSVNCGVRKYRPDIGVVVSDSDCVAVGMYTVNKFSAAPVRYCQEILPSKSIRAVLCNSGQANAATGKQGEVDNKNLIAHMAKQLEIESNQVIISSTGVIGVALDMEKLLEGVEQLALRRSNHAEAFATAIMTTDLVPKTVSKDLKLSTGNVTITGICKGSGMIHPNMATMLGYLFTDAVVSVDVAKDVLKEAVDKSFNMISVDGDTSTNDSVFLLANGESKISLANDQDKKLFQEAITELAIFMARAIASDGEGATKLIEVEVKGLDSLELSRKVARGIVTSPLIKCAIHGEDPNWGRIYSRLGQEGVPYEWVSKLDLSIQDVSIVEKGEPLPFDYYKMKTGFAEDEIHIEIDFGSDQNRVKAWGCDLSKKYVDINTAYN